MTASCTISSSIEQEIYNDFELFYFDLCFAILTLPLDSTLDLIVCDYIERKSQFIMHS